MKITRKDLDSTIVEKLDLLDNVISTYDSNNPDGFVSYNNNSGFYFKKTNDTFLKRVYTEDELVELEKLKFSTNKNVTSSATKDLRLDNKINYAASKFLYNLDFTGESLIGKPQLLKSLKDYLAVLTRKGVLVLINTTAIEINIISLLYENFSLSDKLSINDIIDIAEFDGDNILIATSNFGIFKYTISTQEIELSISLLNVKNIEVTATGNIFVAGDTYCGQYTLDNKCVEKYNNIYNERQVPMSVLSSDSAITVLAAPTGVQNLDNILHYWLLDSAGVGYNCKDAMIEKNPRDNRYQIMFMKEDDSYIYLSGLFVNRIFVWKYSKSDFSLTEELLTDKMLQYTDFLPTENGYLILSNNMLYVIRNCEINEIYKLSKECSQLIFHNGVIYIGTSAGIAKLELLKFEKKSDTLSYQLFKSDTECNNIDILVIGATRTERITLFDGDTNKEIIPSYYMIYSGNAILKLLNCKSKNIVMKISVTPTSKLDAVIVKKNRMFLR